MPPSSACSASRSPAFRSKARMNSRPMILRLPPGLRFPARAVRNSGAASTRTGSIEPVLVEAAPEFLTALAGKRNPGGKRKIIGREFIRAFERKAGDLDALHADDGGIQFLVQGTLYPDVVESGGGTSAASIKSHHNVGGLPEDLKFKLIEPLRLLFKDEVRAVGLELGLPESMVWRHPFPGPG